ncbi:MAG: hypothetical protein AAFV77_09255 [Planctomycetota bacterium]
MDELVKAIFDEGNLFWIIGGTIAIVAIVFGTIAGAIKRVAREKTRREIAAYIAEGSMTPEQGEKLMRAVPDDDD